MTTPVSGGSGHDSHKVYQHTSQIAPSRIQVQPKIGISHLRTHNITLGEDPQTSKVALTVFTKPI